MFDLIVSQGLIADRTAHTIEGATLTARELERRYETKGQYLGKAALPADDDWRVSLSKARETLVGLARAIETSIENGQLIVVSANTCSASIASLPVVARNYPDAVVLWIDAHGDFNTPETTDTGYLGGMVVSAACGLWESGHGAGLQPENVVLIGARDIDDAEGKLLRSTGVRIIPPSEVTPEAVLGAINGAYVWIHVDWDVLEPGFVSADYKVSGGLLPTQLRAVFEALPLSRLLGVELAEFHAPTDDANRTAALSIILDIVSPLLKTAEKIGGVADWQAPER